MATIIAYKEIDNAIEKLVDSSSQKNTADILCPKEGCKCVVLKKNTATLVEREGSKVIDDYTISFFLYVLTHCILV
jgi:hypothetical protein